MVRDEVFTWCDRKGYLVTKVISLSSAGPHDRPEGANEAWLWDCIPKRVELGLLGSSSEPLVLKSLLHPSRYLSD